MSALSRPRCKRILGAALICLCSTARPHAAVLSGDLRTLVERGDRDKALLVEPPPGDLERALLSPNPRGYLKAATAGGPVSAQAERRRLLAYLALAAGDAEAIILHAAYLSDSLTAERYFFEAQYLLAQGELLAGHLDAASRRLDWLSRHAEQPWRGFGLYGQAQCALRHDTAEAIRLLKACGQMRAHEATAPALYQLGQVYEAQGNARQAIRYLTMYREAYPQGMLPVFDATGSVSARAEEVAGLLYTIQVGVFSDRTNAVRQKERFEKLGYPVQLTLKDVAGSRYTAVWVGRYKSRGLAQERRRELETKFDDTYRVVVIE